jgi:hypothetical protein
MRQHLFIAAFAGLVTWSYAQSDIDAIRYSRAGAGGTSRALAMGGAFGAVGADVSAGAYNPAGLALFRKGEFSFSGGLKYINNNASLHNSSTRLPDLRFVFNNFGLVLAWTSGRDPDSRHAIAFASTQVQNFSNSVRMSGYTNNGSISRDMVNLANEQGDLSTLNPGYEGLAYDTYLLDYDSAQGRFYSLLDTKRTIRQVRDLTQSGRQNDLNISYAFSYKDKFYVGASLGIPRIEYVSNTSHFEYDDNDSIRITFTSPSSYTHTFIDPLPSLSEDYYNKGAFSSLEYVEYFKTTGTGYNLKLGGVARVNDMVRLGLYYHTPTIYRLTDLYQYQMYSYFDQRPGTPEEYSFPEDGGTFEYRVITPSRLGLNSAFVFGKRAILSLDYEVVNYRSAQIRSEVVNDFAGVNNTIQAKYSRGHNIKAGTEFNFGFFMLRGGYAMMGSPFGDAFSGDFVRHTVSLGAGIRPKTNFYLDVVWLNSFSAENYFLFTTLETMSKISYSSNVVGLTAGLRF